eukprot:TRINITY_DN2853_c2_g1_i1.p1 TRINITY_DN2853_c2_g1~~TRINITY_DN2853_c2_g1_i1.p1  ORF type:complete len:498 (-),score=174.91 TRINITY_DN2853_c2_g1_i1:72-1565(-)
MSDQQQDGDDVSMSDPPLAAEGSGDAHHPEHEHEEEPAPLLHQNSEGSSMETSQESKSSQLINDSFDSRDGGDDDDDDDNDVDADKNEDAPVKSDVDKDAEKKKELAKELFGDSDDEGDFELAPPDNNIVSGSSDDDEEYVEKSKQKLKRLVKQRNRKKRDSDDDEDGEKKSKKKRSRKKREEGEEAEDEERKATKRAKKKEAEPEPEPDDGIISDGDSRYKRRQQMQGDAAEFDEAVGRVTKRRPKKINEDDAAFSAAVKANVQELISNMVKAASADVVANTNKEPATAKIAMLSTVTENLSKGYFAKEFVEKEGLKAIFSWLDVLPDKSLPSLNIRDQLLSLLLRMPCSTDQLRASEVGKTVMHLYHSKLETAANRKICGQLIEKWSRPIFRLNSGYKDMRDEEDEYDRPSVYRRNYEREETEIDRQTRKETQDNKRFHAAIPTRVAFDFKKRPTSDLVDKSIPIRNPHATAAAVDKLLQKKEEIESTRKIRRKS